MSSRLSSGFLRRWRNGTGSGDRAAEPDGAGGRDGAREPPETGQSESGSRPATEAPTPVAAATPAAGPVATAATPDASQLAVGTAAASPPPVMVPRWIQLVVLPLALLGLWALARAAGTIVLVLIAASIVALIFNPLVRMLGRARVPRGLAILLIYLGCFAILGGVGVLLADPVGNQVNRFAGEVPSFIKHANHDLDSLQRFFNRHGIKIQIEKQGQTALQTLEKNVLKGSGNVVSFSRDLLSKIVTVSFDLVLILVLSVYLLVYGREIGSLVRRVMPPGDGTPEDDFPVLVQRAVFGYVRGQLLFSLIMGTSAGLCLWIVGEVGIFPAGAHYAVFFGGFYGLMELIPYIGPILGAVPPVLVALFNDPISAVWVVLLFVALQQLEGHFVAPQVFRLSLRINPILIILSLLIGYQLYGIPGALVALPSAAVIRETVMYLRLHLVLEPWSTADPGAGVLGATAPGAAAEATAPEATAAGSAQAEEPAAGEGQRDRDLAAR